MNVHDILFYANRTVERSIDDLPDDAWLTPGVCGIWSVKDIIAHLASFEHLLVDVVKSLTEDSPTLTLQRYLLNGSFNDNEVAKRADLSARQIWEEYASTHLHTLELVDHLPPDMYRKPGILTWYGDEYDFEDFIVYSYYGHKREHTAQINVFKDYLNGITPGKVSIRDNE